MCATIRVGKMSYGLNKTLQMCTVKIKLKVDLVTNLPKSESKSKSSKNGFKSGLQSKSGLEYYKSGEMLGIYVT